jgi:hypothetical protein
VDTIDLVLLSQIWSHSAAASFIYPLGEEHGFDAVETTARQRTARWLGKAGGVT